MAPRQSRFVALLRGINVGGKNKVPMAALRELFEAAGASEVKTYIQSGNLLFSAPTAKAAATMTEGARAGLAATLGVDTPILVRSARQLMAVAKAHPLAQGGDLDKLLMVAFLSAKPKAAAVRDLDPQRSPPDTFQVVGSEVYLRYPEGSRRTKLNQVYLDRTLGTVCTVRNWRTVNKLVELL